MSEVNWYVVHTYSGYKNKVKANIEKTIENRHLEDQILEVRVPMEEVVEVKNGTKKQVLRKFFPGYVLINMIMNDDTWYVVRNTRGVTGFVGPGSKPVPLTDEEMVNLGITGGEEKVELDLEVGDAVVVTGGAWKDTTGLIQSNLLEESCIQVTVYDDRLEVTSPSGLYNGLTYEEVMNGHSKIRNKGIANIFSQMGLVEAWGSGIKRILNAAEEYGLPKPRFQEFDNMFRVELFRVNPITNQVNQDFERLDQAEEENVLSEKEIEILNLVRMQPSITQKEMANALDWNLASVKYYITKLKEKNYLKRQGSSQKGKWVILTKRD